MGDVAALRDWLFAKDSKRNLLEALLADPGRRWTRLELATVAGLHEKARMDLHLGPLVTAGLLRRDAGAYMLVADHAIAGTLRQLLVELGAQLPVA